MAETARTDKRRLLHWPSILLGACAASAVLWSANELRYVDWQPLSKPLGLEALTIRADAKGDGRFGAPRSGNRQHRGIDIAAPMGSPVLAIRSGQVIATGTHRGLGRYVELEHPSQLRSVYAHLQTIDVTVGERIRQGQSIGTVGKTGNARHPLIQPHLHLEISQAGQVIDPGSLGLALSEPVVTGPDAADGGG